MYNQNFTSATNSYNVAVGYDAGVSVTTAQYNTLVGGLAGRALTVGNSNVALGYAALYSDTKGDRNVAIGLSALENQNFTSTTDSYNTAVGYVAGQQITTGVRNTLIGRFSGSVITTGDSNSILGAFSGNQDSLDIRTGSNYIVLSDGDGNVGLTIKDDGTNKIIYGYDTKSFAAGQTLPSSTDYDDIKFPGMYRVDNNATNAPTTNFHALVVFGNADNVTTQIATKIASTETYVRSFNTSWTSWARLDT